MEKGHCDGLLPRMAGFLVDAFDCVRPISWGFFLRSHIDICSHRLPSADFSDHPCDLRPGSDSDWHLQRWPGVKNYEMDMKIHERKHA
jgi:hypothetical protein